MVSAWEPWQLTDGAAFVLAHHLRVLAARHDITVLAAGARQAAAPAPPEAVELLPGVRLKWFGAGRSRTADFLSRTAWSVRTGEPAHVGYVERPGLLEAFDAVVAEGVDLVHLHGWGTARLAQRAPQLPAVHMAIDPWSANHGNRRLPAVQRLMSAGQPARIRRHEQAYYPHLAAVVVVTPEDVKLVRAVAPGANVVVVGNGVDPGPEPTPMPGGDPVLGFHGVFDSRANVDAARDLVTQIWPRVRAKVPETRVLLVGRRPPREVRRLADPHGVELRTNVADVRDDLERITVHVDWMTSGAGIKNKVLEAMAAGRPVVASPAGAAGIGPGAGVVIAPDIAAAADAIVEWVCDPQAARAAGAAGRRRVLDEFSWADSAGALEGVWRAAAERSPQ